MRRQTSWEPVVYVGSGDDAAAPDRVAAFVTGLVVGVGVTAALVLVVLAWPVTS